MIYDNNRIITYRELNSLINAASPKQIFYAHPTLETIVNILACVKTKTPFYPISPREPHLPSPPPCDPSICSCLITSGTTFPKYATHTWDNHYQSALHPHPDLTLTPSDRWLLSLPLNHIGGLAILFRCFLSQAAIILPSSDPSLATIISFVPTQLKRYLASPYPLPHLRALLLGGAPIPEHLCQDAFNKGLPLYLTYGMTEMSSQITTSRYLPQNGVHLGHPLPHRELMIQTDGEILVRGKTLFAGYLNCPTPMQDGWFQTGDLGEMTPHGLIHKGRKDKMIISGGENIHLEEIEQSLMSLPEIIQVSCTSRLDPDYGQRPVAKIALKTPITPEEIHSKLQEFLPKYKIPAKDDLLIMDPAEVKGKG